MSAAPYTAPTTRNRNRDLEQGVQTPSSRTQITGSSETMSATPLTEAQQLAEARENVRQLQEQLDDARTASQRGTPLPQGPNPKYTIKLKDKDPLTDGVSPTFANWRVQLEDKFLINGFMFDSEQAKMAYIFNSTAEIAQDHLAPRYRKGPEPFKSSVEMIAYLAEILENPFEAQDARAKYRKMTMEDYDSFAAFYTQFLHLASLGRIPTDDLQPDLYEKLTPSLQQSVMPFLDILLTSTALANKCRMLDNHLRRLQDRRAQLRAARPNARTAKASTTSRQAVTTTSVPLFTRASSPKPVAKVYGPVRESTPVRKDPEDVCFRCKQPGHFAKDCSEPPKPRTEVSELTKPSLADDSDSESGKDEA